MAEYFPKPINSTDDFFRKLEEQGKVRKLNSPEDFKKQEEVNKTMLETRADYLRMDADSNARAKECYVGVNDLLF